MHLYGIDSTSRKYVIYYGHSDIHPRPDVIPGAKEKEELPKGQCLRRPVCVREPWQWQRLFSFHQLLVETLLPHGKAQSSGWTVEVSISLWIAKHFGRTQKKPSLLLMLEEEWTVAHSALIVAFCNTAASIDTTQTNPAIESTQGMCVEAAECSFVLSILPAYVKRQEYASSVTQWKTNCWAWETQKILRRTSPWSVLLKRQGFLMLSLLLILHSHSHVPGKWFSVCTLYVQVLSVLLVEN